MSPRLLDRIPNRIHLTAGTCLAISLALLLATQLPAIGRPFVNLEFAANEGANALAWPQHTDRIQYCWRYQATPLGYSLTLAAILRLTGQDGSFAISRIPSIAGCVAILVAGYIAMVYRCEEERSPVRLLIWSLAIISHPMIWLYTNHCSADILATGLMALALACCLYGSRSLTWHVLGGVIFAFSCITKFNCVLMGAGFAHLILDNRMRGRVAWKQLVPAALCYTVLPAAAGLVYFYWIYHTHGILFIPEIHKATHSIDPSFLNWCIRLAKYASFLCVFTGPFLLVWLHATFARATNAVRISLVLVSVLVGILGFWIISPMHVGEMDFGGLAGQLPPWFPRIVEAGGLSLSVLLACGMTAAALKNRDSHLRFLLAVIVPYLLIASAARPTQRYLILLLPYVLWWLTVEAVDFKSRWLSYLAVPTVILMATITFVGATYLSAQGHAANNMAMWIKRHGIADQTAPDRWMINHAAYHFPVNFPQPARYHIQTLLPGVEPRRGPILHREKVSIFGCILREHILIDSIPAHARAPSSGPPSR